MDQREIDDILLRHVRRAWLWCSCGRRWSRCSPRREAEFQRTTLRCRARLDDVIAKGAINPRR